MIPDAEERARLLVKQFLQSRSEEAFKELYRAYTTDLFRLAQKLTNGNTATSSDIVQEMWVRSMEALPTFQWKSSLKTWLTGILINCYREEIRKRTIHTQEVMELNAIHELQLDTKMDAQKALSALPAGYKEILILHDVEGYKHEEIGAMLGISEGTSKSQLFHARNAMRKLLA